MALVNRTNANTTPAFEEMPEFEQDTTSAGTGGTPWDDAAGTPLTDEAAVAVSEAEAAAAQAAAAAAVANAARAKAKAAAEAQIKAAAEAKAQAESEMLEATAQAARDAVAAEAADTQAKAAAKAAEAVLATATPAPAPAAATQVAKPLAPTTTSTAVAPVRSTALAAGANRPAQIGSYLRNNYLNAMHVAWDTCDSLKLNKVAQFTVGTAELGREIGIELLSMQDTWMISVDVAKPTDDQRAMLRNSDDGVYIQNSETTVEEHLALIASKGWVGKVQKRLILVGMLTRPADTSANAAGLEMFDEQKLVQISLSPTSRSKFEAYDLEQTVKMHRVLPGAAPRQPHFIILSSVEAKNGQHQWSIITFRPDEETARRAVSGLVG